MNEEKLLKVRSVVNHEIYYTSKRFPLKEIDGRKYIRVLRSPMDTSKIFMAVDKVEYIRG